MKLWMKIAIAITLGIITGIVLGPQAAIFSWIGNSFLKLLSMLIVPIIFASVVSSIATMPSTEGVGTIGGLTLGLYIFSTLFAITLGLALTVSVPIGSFFADAIHPAAAGSLISTSVEPLSKDIQSISSLLLSLVPKNPIKALADQNILQIIVFGSFFGIALNLSGQRGSAVKDVVSSLAVVMQKMTSIVMRFSPIGVFALMATAVGNLGISMLGPIFLFLLFYYAACLLHAAIVFCGMLKSVGLNPRPFFKGSRDIILTAMSTCSSSASLPVAIECSTNKLGVSPSLAGFVLPLGCSLNMNGSALFQIMASIFMAQAYGIPLSAELYATLCFTVIFATMGTASIPGSGVMMLSVVFASIGIPLEALALLVGIDRLRDMATTALNVLGDAACAVTVAEYTHQLDRRIYSSEEKMIVAATDRDA